MNDKDFPEVDSADAGAEVQEPSNEPWGAQVLRRVHEDHSLLMKDYDEMMGPLEHEGIKSHMQDHMGTMDKFLTKSEQLFKKHYKELPGLEGAMEQNETDKDLDDGVETDSSPEEDAPTGDEALEGMENKDDEDMPTEEEKSLYKKKHLRKSAEEEEKEKALRFYRRAKGLCPTCGKDPCVCKKSLNKKKKSAQDPEDIPGYEEYQDKPGKPHGDADIPETPGNEENDEGPRASEGLPGTKDLEPHELDKVNEAKDYLKDLSEEQNFGEEHRMKAYHYHKALEPMGESSDEEMKGFDPSEVDGKSGMDPETVPGYEEFQDKPGQPGSEEDFKSFRKSIGEASEHFRSLSQEKAFGDEHRMKCMMHHKALDDHLNGVKDFGELDSSDQGVEVTEPGEKDFPEVDDADEGVEVTEPGEKGVKDDDDMDGEEKSLRIKKLKNILYQQNKQIAALARKLPLLNGKV